MGDFKAIETPYKGVLFRSRLEAQWAEFFDAIHTRWLYEPAGFTDGKVRYLPDFYLPDACNRGEAGGCFFEVKPPFETTWSDDYEKAVKKAQVIVLGTGKPLIMATESPSASQHEYLIEFAPYGPEGSRECGDDHGLTMACCEKCGRLNFGYHSGDWNDCPCGGETSYTDRLELARASFPNYCRWVRAA